MEHAPAVCSHIPFRSWNFRTTLKMTLSGTHIMKKSALRGTSSGTAVPTLPTSSASLAEHSWVLECTHVMECPAKCKCREMCVATFPAPIITIL